MPKTRIVSPFPVFESIQETPHRQKGALSPFNCISIPQSRVCGKEKPFRICKFLLRWCVLFHVFSEFFHFFRKKGLLFLLGFGIVYKSQGHARLAQLVEHLLDVQEVTGSSPVPSTIQFVLEPDSLRKRVRVRFLFIGGSAEGLLGTVNEQRQGITMIVVSCLFALQKEACFVRTWPPLQDGRLKTTSFQTKVFHCISQKSMFQ